MEKEILRERLVPVAEVRRILEERKQQGELSYLQRITLEHAQRFTKISIDRAYVLIKILQKDYGISEPIANQIVNVMPKSIEELRVFFTGQKLVAVPKTDEELILILKTLLEFVFSMLIEQNLEIPEKKIIKLMGEKPRSVGECVKLLALRGTAKVDRGKEVFSLYLQIMYITALIAEHYLIPDKAIELTNTLPKNREELKSILGDLIQNPQSLSNIEGVLKEFRIVRSFTVDFDLPFSISKGIAETSPTEGKDLKDQLGAVGESLTAKQITELLKIINP